MSCLSEDVANTCDQLKSFMSQSISFLSYLKSKEAKVVGYDVDTCFPWRVAVRVSLHGGCELLLHFHNFCMKAEIVCADFVSWPYIFCDALDMDGEEGAAIKRILRKITPSLKLIALSLPPHKARCVLRWVSIVA